MENRKTIERFNGTKSLHFRKINNIDKPLVTNKEMKRKDKNDQEMKEGP